MRKVLLILLISFFLAGTNQAVGRIPAKQQQTVRSDSSKLTPRTFEPNALNKFRSDKEFQYGLDYQTAQSWWDRFWRWFWLQFSNVVEDTASNNIVRNISLLVLAGLIIFLVIKFSGAGVLALFTGKGRSVPLPYSESAENIHEINFDAEIENAVRNRDYRLAVRLSYLKCLKRLSDSGLIAWQIDKTNSDYISELINSGKQDKFKLLTRQFEYIWYGEFKIDQATFYEIQNQFGEFNRELN